jgi:ABC-2 type transport system permease protein
MIRSEWIKLWSVRSTWWTLGIATVLMVGTAGVFAATTDMVSMKAPTDALQGGILVQLAFGVIGAMFIASEYSTGQIKTTFAAVPSRRKAVMAKGAVLLAVLYVSGQAVTAASFFVAEAVFAHRGVHMSITGHGTALSVTGMGFYMCFVGLFGFALGVLLRSTAAAVTVLVGIVFLLMGLLPRFVPSDYSDTVGKFTFTKVAQSLVQTVRPPHAADSATLLSTGMAWLVCLGYLAVSIAIPVAIADRGDAT